MFYNLNTSYHFTIYYSGRYMGGKSRSIVNVANSSDLECYIQEYQIAEYCTFTYLVLRMTSSPYSSFNNIPVYLHLQYIDGVSAFTSNYQSMFLTMAPYIDSFVFVFDKSSTIRTCYDRRTDLDMNIRRLKEDLTWLNSLELSLPVKIEDFPNNTYKKIPMVVQESTTVIPDNIRFGKSRKVLHLEDSVPIVNCVDFTAKEVISTLEKCLEPLFAQLSEHDNHEQLASKKKFLPPEHITKLLKRMPGKRAPLSEQ